MNHPQRGWTGEGKGTPRGYRFFMIMVRLFGPLPAYFFLVFVVLRYALGQRGARAAIVGLRRRLGLPAGFAAVYRHFFSFGMSLVDRFAFLQLRHPPFEYSCVNEEIIAGAAAQGRGVILLSAHVGNWEIGGNLLGERIRTPINVVMLDAEREALQRVMRPLLERRRVNVIALTPGSGDAVIRIMAALRRGEIVGMLGDRVLGDAARRLDFLGAPALFPTGPFAVAAASGAPIIPIATVKTGLRHYTFRAWDPIRIGQSRGEGRERAIGEAMRRYVSILEEIVRNHPLQWYNFHEFWEP